MPSLYCQRLVIGWLGLLSVLPVKAEPRIPTDSAEVLEVLPTRLGAETTTIHALRTNLQAEPTNLAAATQLAQTYIALGRSNTDPRYFGYAQAALTPWWNEAQPPPGVQLLRATLYQHQHDYVQARRDLEALLHQDSSQLQAWLTLAVIQTVQGDYADSRHSCLGLAKQGATWYASLCLSQVMSLTGQAERAYQLQTSLLPSLKQQAVELRQWLLTLMAETAWKLAKVPEAEQHFKAALAEQRRDPYLLRVYSYFLLEQQRPQEVIALLKDETRDDALLLVLTIASRDAKQSEATQQYRQLLEQRFAAAELRATMLPAEEAWYYLEFGDAKSKQKALDLAQRNWQVQKEPSDTLLLLKAAVLNQAWDTAQAVQQWLNTHQQQDARFAPWLAQIPKGQGGEV